MLTNEKTVKKETSLLGQKKIYNPDAGLPGAKELQH